MLLFAAAANLPYLIAGRKPVAPITAEKNVVTADAVIESIAVTPEGRRLVFWCESTTGPITSCFAQSFSPAGAPESSIVPVFDLPFSEAERLFSRSGAALWIGDDEALLLIATRRPVVGNQLFVQHWKHGRVNEPAVVSTATELAFWETLVRLPSGEVYAVWQEEKRAFSICARRITPDGTPDGTVLKLQKIFELATPGAVAAGATKEGICLTWSEVHQHHPTVYFAQFDRKGERVGEPQIVFDDREVDEPRLAVGRDDQVFIAARSMDEAIFRPLGKPVVMAGTGVDHRSIRMAVNDAGEVAVAWTRLDQIWLRSGSARAATLGEFEPPFLSLHPHGTSWLLHFRLEKPNEKLRYMWLTYVDYNAKSGI